MQNTLYFEIQAWSPRSAKSRLPYFVGTKVLVECVCNPPFRSVRRSSTCGTTSAPAGSAFSENNGRSQVDKVSQNLTIWQSKRRRRYCTGPRSDCGMRRKGQSAKNAPTAASWGGSAHADAAQSENVELPQSEIDATQDCG